MELLLRAVLAIVTAGIYTQGQSSVPPYVPETSEPPITLDGDGGGVDSADVIAGPLIVDYPEWLRPIVEQESSEYFIIEQESPEEPIVEQPEWLRPIVELESSEGFIGLAETLFHAGSAGGSSGSLGSFGSGGSGGSGGGGGSLGGFGSGGSGGSGGGGGSLGGHGSGGSGGSGGGGGSWGSFGSRGSGGGGGGYDPALGQSPCHQTTKFLTRDRTVTTTQTLTPWYDGTIYQTVTQTSIISKFAFQTVTQTSTIFKTVTHNVNINPTKVAHLPATATITK